MEILNDDRMKQWEEMQNQLTQLQKEKEEKENTSVSARRSVGSCICSTHYPILDAGHLKILIISRGTR
jgi:hypothetical protein